MRGEGRTIRSGKRLILVLPKNCFVYLCGDHATVFMELNIVELLHELTKLGDNWNDSWNDSVVQRRTKKIAK